MDNSNQETPINISEKEVTEHPKVVVNKLPTDIVKGSQITFRDSFYSNPDDFDFFYMAEIAKKYNLDPASDYDKIRELSQDENNREIIKKKLQSESSNTCNVTEAIIPENSKEDIPNFDYPEAFFERFNHLPQGGMVKINPAELHQAEHLYIGGGQTTEAFDNIQKGFYGDENEYPTYFTTDFELAMSHMHDGNEADKPVLIEISSKKLSESRTIFQDPESLYIKSEKGKTFIAFHGIPVSAIERIITLEKNES